MLLIWSLLSTSIFTRNSVRGDGESDKSAFHTLTPSSGLEVATSLAPASSRKVACQSITCTRPCEYVVPRRVTGRSVLEHTRQLLRIPPSYTIPFCPRRQRGELRSAQLLPAVVLPTIPPLSPPETQYGNVSVWKRNSVRCFTERCVHFSNDTCGEQQLLFTSNLPTHFPVFTSTFR